MLSQVVTDGASGRYAVALHIDYETPSREAEMHGQYGQYINDLPLGCMPLPGFTGLGVTSYQLQGSMEVSGGC